MAEEFDAKPWSLAAAAEELVELWTMFPFDADEAAVAVRIGLIEHISNRMMRDCGDHEAVDRRLFGTFPRCGSVHRVSQPMGLTLQPCRTVAVEWAVERPVVRLGPRR